MRTKIRRACGAIAIGLAGIAAANLANSGADYANANGKKSLKPTAHPAVLPSVNPDHQSMIRVSDRELPAHKMIKIARNKSALVELPRDLRDVVVSNPEMLDAVVQSANRVYLIGKKIGQANAFFFDANGDQVLTLEVVIEQDVAPLEALFKRLIPGSSIKVEALNDTFILTGSVVNPVDSNRAVDIASRFAVTATPEGDARMLPKVINMLSVEGEEQVMLRVTVAEVQRSLLKQLGVNFGATTSAGNFLFDVLTANALPVTAAAGLGRLPVPGIDGDGDLSLYNNGPAKNVFGNSGGNAGWTSGRNRLVSTLRLMERDGLVRTLAEPNLTTVSGETAKFLAGGEYPIPVVDNTGQLSVTFKEFGVGLSFTPVVLSEGRISLKIETEVSELSDVGAVTLSNVAIPALKKRQAKTTLELPSGGSLAMAGLISEDTRQNIDGMPGLKNLPVLGNLFRSRDFSKNETELVVIVTPVVVRPTARSKLARPDDNFAPASDAKAIFFGQLNRIYGKGTTVPTGGLKGDYGFIVD